MSDFKRWFESATPHPERRPLTRSVASPKGQLTTRLRRKTNQDIAYICSYLLI
ncbi:MAG: hypothetical protein SO255_00715 [Sodaliphilus sp.]|nr:hypothetical protein [Sodaliphilus sp.]